MVIAYSYNTGELYVTLKRFPRKVKKKLILEGFTIQRVSFHEYSPLSEGVSFSEGLFS